MTIPNSKTVEFTLSSSVADSGTFTVNYPDGYNDGNFENARGHFIMLNGAELRQPQDIGLSFGDTSVTVTNRTGASLAAGTGNMTFMFPGKSTGIMAEIVTDNSPFKTAIREVGGRKLVPLYIDLGAPLTADSDGISASQSVSSGVAALLNGALLDGDGDMILDGTYGRNVVASWTGTAVLTLVGEDYLGQLMTEQSASGTSLTGVKAFKKILSATFNADVTSATIGTGQVLGLPVKISDQSEVLAEFEAGVALKKLNEIEKVPFAILEAEADAATSVWIVPGFAGSVLSMTTVVGDTITTGGTLTVEIGGTAVDGLGVVIANSSSAGDVDTDTATAGHATAVFTATQALEIVGDSAIDSSGRIRGHVECRRTSTLNGTLVTGLATNTKATATNADPRGTYDPVTTLDGSTSFALYVLVPQPDHIGAQQYNA